MQHLVSQDTLLAALTPCISIIVRQDTSPPQVLLQEPSKVYTSDLRRVVRHLQMEGRLLEAPPTSNYIGPPSTPAIQVEGEGQMGGDCGGERREVLKEAVRPI